MTTFYVDPDEEFEIPDDQKHTNAWVVPSDEPITGPLDTDED